MISFLSQLIDKLNTNSSFDDLKEDYEMVCSFILVFVSFTIFRPVVQWLHHSPFSFNQSLFTNELYLNRTTTIFRSCLKLNFHFLIQINSLTFS